MNTSNRRQRGITLIEALIGFLILCIGLVGAIRLQSHMRLMGDIAHQRSAAVRMAQQDMEQLRASAATTTQPPTSAPGPMPADPSAAFTLDRHTAADGGLQHGLARVSWVDRSGATQDVELRSSVFEVSPVYSAALALPMQDAVISTRHRLSAASRQLGRGRSVVKLSATSRTAWVIDNATATVTRQCQVAADLAAQAITEADLTGCVNATGALLRGFIRFSLGAEPDPQHANDAPLPLTLAPMNTNGARCEADTVGNSSSPERYLAYACLVPVAQGDWGAVQITPRAPQTWSLGLTADTFKVCRYANVTAHEAPQNYLVIRGDAACPAAVTPHNAHNGVSVATVQHQP